MLIRRAGAVMALAVGLAIAAPLAGTGPVQAADPDQPVRLAIAVPITAPGTSTGLLDAGALEAYTRPLGLLTRQLDAVFGRPVAIGIDPMIIASIRALGSIAPESAVAWLDRLADAPNQIFPLAYADLDVTLATQAGAAELPLPTAFALDPAVVPVEEPTGTPTPEPTDGPPGPDLPDVEDLLEWSYSVTGLAWPRDDTVVDADLAPLSASEYTATIFSSTNLARNASASPTTTIDGQSVLVSDAGVSAALRDAAAATDPAIWADAMTAVSDALAAAARVQPGEQATVFATLGRDVPVTEGRLAETLGALETDARVQSIPLSIALSSAPDEATIVEMPQPPERVAQTRLLLAADASVQQFATVAADPTTVGGPERLSLLGLLSNGWESSPSGWPAAVAEHLASATALIALVQVGETSRLNLLADRQTLPIPIINGLSQAITVVVTVDPTTPILAIEDRAVELTLEPNSQANALVPVQAVSNGTVQIIVTLASADGTPIGSSKAVEVVVNAGWETPIFVVLASAVVILFIGGIVRNIVRRRRQTADGSLGD